MRLESLHHPPTAAASAFLQFGVSHVWVEFILELLRNMIIETGGNLTGVNMTKLMPRLMLFREDAEDPLGLDSFTI
jgi:hypothetical protein